MPKDSQSDFEWHVGETDWNDDVEMMDLAQPRRASPEAVVKAIPRRVWWLAGALTLLVVAVVAWQARDTGLSESLVSPNAATGWRTRASFADSRLRALVGDTSDAPRVELSDLELKDKLALVKVTVALPGGPTLLPGYTELRFYERDDDGVWKRTSPDPAFWGEERRLSSDHFNVTYRMRDHSVVRAFVPRLEAYYAEVTRDLKLDPNGFGPFDITVVPSLEGWNWRINDDNRLTVASPLLQPLPLGSQPEDRLMQSVAGPLATYLVDRALAQVPPLEDDHRADWSRVTPALAQWLAAMAAPPSAIQAQMEADFRRDLASGRRVALSSQAFFSGDRGQATLAYNRMAALSLADYVTATYSRDRLGDIIQALPRAASWDDLTRTAFGVDAATFEQGWRDYLAAHFGTPPQAQ